MKNTIGFIGGGRITNIFLHAFESANVSFGKVLVFDPDTETLLKLQNRFTHIECASENIKSAASCNFVFIAVHPPLMIETLTNIKPFLNEKAIVVSLAPKIKIKKIAEVLDGFQAIARVNPSAPGIINQGINPIVFADTMSEDQKKRLLELLHILGKVPVVPEQKIEAYAMINAMGPTYFWFQFKKLEELAISFGMDEKEAKEIISEMINGTLNTLFFSTLSTEEVMDLVPVKPIGEYEETISSFYSEKLNAIYEKIKP
ncbi:MAG: NAD(P)-binding domain-containing protein [Bacteroidetes bacterium]|nr:NAD(P)-binding domain-containing protein [Bacteroidota bacterium]MBL6944188.1 NAD(P)-binding domain-containing protein [Bacteroidales bacterium]